MSKMAGQRRHVRGGAISCVIAAAVLSGCGANATSSLSKTTPKHLTSLKVQLSWLNNVEFAGIYVAEHNGYFKKYGLDVSTTPGGVTVDPRSVVANGAAEIGTVAEGTDVVLGVSSGAPIQAFAAEYQKNPGCLLVKANSSIHSAKDLVGKTIGIQNAARQQIQGILQYNHIPQSKVKIEVVGSSPTPLVLGKIDAFTAFDFNEPVALRLQGIKVRCLSFSDIGLPAYGDVFIAKTSTIKSQAKVLAEFVKAVQRGWAYTKSHQTQVADMILANFAPQEDKKQQHAQVPVEISLLLTPGSKGLMWMAPPVWQRSIQFMKSEGVMKKQVTVNQVMTLSIWQRAGKL
jgi:NitT/TauT family transport system substrate-binding protein